MDEQRDEIETIDGIEPMEPWLEPGRVIARRFRLGAEIGSGAAGRVHLARRLSDGREVVLKIGTSGRRHRDRMRAEARALSSLEHPNVVRFVEHGECGDVAFVAMEAIHGNSLDAQIAAGPIPRATAILWLFELAEALDHVHARGLVHRDLKPANIMIDTHGKRIVLVDFGLATDYRVAAPPKDQAHVLGTPEYMAPEQALGLESQIGPATDRYAFAAIALELLTGERAYPAMSLGRLLVTILEQPPRRPSALGYGGPELDAVFARAMARDPSRRFASAHDQVASIVAALPHARDPIPSQRAPKPARTVRVKAA